MPRGRGGGALPPCYSIRLQMISSRDICKVVGDAKFYRQIMTAWELVAKTNFTDRCWCSADIPLEEGTSVVGLLGCLVDVLRPCTVLVESHSKVLCCVSHLQCMPVDVVLGDDRRWLPCDSQ